MRVLLISTYELGRQPVHLASPAAALQAAGHEVATVDVAVGELSGAMLADADKIAISVPMHTAMRLAISTAEQIKAMRPDIPVAFYGLYAAVGANGTGGSIADRLIAGEYEPALVKWVEAGGSGVTIEVSRSGFKTPFRQALPPLESYARLEWEGEARVVGAVEASHGCRHRCRHCPIPVVYDGRWRPVGGDIVAADIAAQASSGADHITFGDPDFLNAPRYSLDILREAHSAFPELTFDVTVKVSHILQHAQAITEMASLGVLFIVSAFETVDETALDILDKNHVVEDMTSALGIVRDAGVFLRPTWLPFFPWTAAGDIADLVGFLDHHRLWEATDPVQLAIRLLIPQGSLLEDHPQVRPHLTGYRPGALTWDWEFADRDAEDLYKRLDFIAAEASDCGAESLETLAAMRDLITSSHGSAAGPMPEGLAVPRLSESWFCCAEPTEAQSVSISASGITVPSFATEEG